MEAMLEKKNKIKIPFEITSDLFCGPILPGPMAEAEPVIG